MDIQYVYTKKRSEFGRQVHLTDRSIEITKELETDPALAAQYIRRNPIHTGTQHVRDFSEHWVCVDTRQVVVLLDCNAFEHLFQVNTDRLNTESRGVNHVEGGWPRDIQPHEPEQTSRFRRRAEKEPGYGRAILSLGQVNILPSVRRTFLRFV